MIDLYPYHHLPPLWAAVAAHVAVAGFLLLILVALVAHLRHRRRAARLAARVPVTELSPSDEALVYGTVEAGADVTPVTVEITQRLRPNPESPERRKAWLESARKVTGHPFHLRLPTGQRIRVEPDANTVLIDPTLEMIEGDSDTRVRRAELRDGAEAHVLGAIVKTSDPEAGFRGGSALVMRPGPTMVVSTVGLGYSARMRARQYAWATAAACLFGATSLLLLGYFRMLYSGVTVEAEVTQLRVVSTPKDDGGATSDRIVQLRIASGQPHAGHVFEQEIWESDYGRLKRGMVVPARLIVGVPDSARLGGRASFWIVFVIPVFIGLILAAAVVGLTSRRPAGWWEPPLTD